MIGEAPPNPRHRLWPWYTVYYSSNSGGDFCSTTARGEAHAAAIIYQRHLCPGMRIERVEFAKEHPLNRAMMGLTMASRRACLFRSAA